MPWQDLLSPAQRVQVLALPTSLREYEELYTLTPADLEFVAAHRTDTNRLGGRSLWRASEVLQTPVLEVPVTRARPNDFLLFEPPVRGRHPASPGRVGLSL
jgi:hypothetical protein